MNKPALNHASGELPACRQLFELIKDYHDTADCLNAVLEGDTSLETLWNLDTALSELATYFNEYIKPALKNAPEITPLIEAVREEITCFLDSEAI